MPDGSHRAPSLAEPQQPAVSPAEDEASVNIFGNGIFRAMEDKARAMLPSYFAGPDDAHRAFSPGFCDGRGNRHIGDIPAGDCDEYNLNASDNESPEKTPFLASPTAVGVVTRPAGDAPGAGQSGRPPSWDLPSQAAKYASEDGKARVSPVMGPSRGHSPCDADGAPAGSSAGKASSNPGSPSNAPSASSTAPAPAQTTPTTGSPANSGKSPSASAPVEAANGKPSMSEFAIQLAHATQSAASTYAKKIVDHFKEQCENAALYGHTSHQELIKIHGGSKSSSFSKDVGREVIRKVEELRFESVRWSVDGRNFQGNCRMNFDDVYQHHFMYVQVTWLNRVPEELRGKVPHRRVLSNGSADFMGRGLIPEGPSTLEQIHQTLERQRELLENALESQNRTTATLAARAALQQETYRDPPEVAEEGGDELHWRELCGT